MNKKRPVVIISQDVLNEQLETVTVCPLTTSLHPAWRTRLGVKVANRESEICVDHIRTISKTRLENKVGELSARHASELRRLITELYGE